MAIAAAAKSRQPCPTLCDPIDGSPPESHPWDSAGKMQEECFAAHSRRHPLGRLELPLLVREAPVGTGM